MAIGEDLGLQEKSEGSACGCGEAHQEMPELDARVIPHAIRHGSIKGALGQLRVGQAMILAAPHDPLPLLKQISEEYPDTYDVSYVEQGPEVWRLKFERR